MCYQFYRTDQIQERMSNEIRFSEAQKAQDEAQWAYEKAKEKFYYSMLEVVFLKIKSHLTQQGLELSLIHI